MKICSIRIPVIIRFYQCSILIDTCFTIFRPLTDLTSSNTKNLPSLTISNIYRTNSGIIFVFPPWLRLFSNITNHVSGIQILVFFSGILILVVDSSHHSLGCLKFSIQIFQSTCISQLSGFELQVNILSGLETVQKNLN